ncbi:ABC transporter permease [Jeotgalicoccus psychrophilus]|uniref:ABC transporter permease n=1 Tax=Jeotgalicoccus psychrophilus TaxID=157228 RepID=UPI00146B935A|nr:ABC transporter permease [Jeotgalicoccus psychrophilus]
MKHIFVFIANDISRLKRKWLTLPLILISPVIFIGLIIWMLSSLLSFDEAAKMSVGLVNLDDSDETAVIVSALAGSAEAADGLEIIEVSESDAKLMIENDTLVSYIIFPGKFTEKMMKGESSELIVVGNPDMQLESYVISSVIDTVVRHIRNSQANILTINHYAREFGMTDEARQNLIFEEFVSQFIQVLSSDTLMDEHQKAQNISAGNMYFIVNGLFIIMTVWVYMLYIALMRDISSNLEDRMKVFGVTHLAQGLARVLSTGIIVTVASALFTYGVLTFGGIDLETENLLRLFILIALHIFITAMIMIIIDWLLPSFKISMVVQLAVLLMIILFAGSIIPRIYFPIYLDTFFDYMYSYQSLSWIEEIILNGRFTMEIDIMIATFGIAAVLLLVLSVLKERRFL